MSATATRGFTIDSLNHVVLRVSDLDRSEAFYRDVLGLQVRRKRPGRMVFFTCGVNDHDIAIMALGPTRHTHLLASVAQIPALFG